MGSPGSEPPLPRREPRGSSGVLEPCPSGGTLLTIRLLGDPDVRFGSDRIKELDAPKLRSLLALLLLHRDAPQQRGHVAFVLWPDSTEPQAKTNLRQLLHYLRRALPDPDRFLIVDTQTIGWRGDAPFWLDVAAFEDAVKRAASAADRESERTALEEATAHHGGDLLPDVYDEWVLPERERLRQMNLGALERLTALLEEDRDHRGAIQNAETLLRHDPLHEATYRRLMRLHALAGERARALRVYHECATTLRQELGVSPSRKTQEAHRRLLSMEDVTPRPDAPTPEAEATSPFVGRHAEWNRCLETYRETLAGRARVLLLEGEAGIGKTRLAEELETWCTRQGHPTARTRTYPAEGRLAYGPVVEWLRSDALRQARRSLDEVWLADLARLLPEIRTDHPDLPERALGSAGDERRRLFQAMTRVILAPERPPLLVLDDLQWADQETLEFLAYLAREARASPLLLIVTLRPEEADIDHPARRLVTGLRALDVLEPIELGPLTPGEIGELASHLAQGELTDDRLQDLYATTEGNPLFVVETFRAAGAGRAIDPGSDEDKPLPPKVQAVIEARLAQLSPPAREIVGLAALIGREFSVDVLRAASGLDGSELVESLDELWARRIVRDHGATAYDFTHDRIREVAASTVGPAHARITHLRVAAALEELHADDVGAVSARLANHYEAAGEIERAIAYYRRAAEHAHDLSAIEETASLLRRALGLLEHLPPGAARDEQEIELRTALGVPLVAIEGYGAPEVRRVYGRARTLCEQIDLPVSPPVLRGLALSALVRCQLEDALRYGRDLLAAAESRDDPLLEVEGNYVLGVTSFWRAEFIAARDHLQRAIDRYDPAQQATHLTLYAQDPKAVCLVRLAYDLWHLGQPDEARALGAEALELAERIEHPHTSAYVLNYACWLANELGEVDEVERLATAAAAASDEHHVGFFHPMGPILTGWATSLRGDPETGVRLIRRGIGTYRRNEQTLHLTYALALLARALLRADDPAAALAVVDGALAETDRTGQRYIQPELHRLRGLGLAREGDEDAAGSSLRTALAVARELCSPALELRAATSLASHHLERGAADDARRVVSAIAGLRDRFEVEDDTIDLQTADDLLAEVRSP